MRFATFLYLALSAMLAGCSTVSKEEAAAAMRSQLSTGTAEAMAVVEVKLLEDYHREHGAPNIPLEPVILGRTVSKKANSKGAWDEVWLVKRGLFVAAYTLHFIPTADGNIDVRPEAAPNIFMAVPNHPPKPAPSAVH